MSIPELIANLYISASSKVEAITSAIYKQIVSVFSHLKDSVQSRSLHFEARVYNAAEEHARVLISSKNVLARSINRIHK